MNALPDRYAAADEPVLRNGRTRAQRLSRRYAPRLELNQAGALDVKVFTFDGDTPGDARQAIRLHSDVVVTNPDMPHQALARCT